MGNITNIRNIYFDHNANEYKILFTSQTTRKIKEKKVSEIEVVVKPLPSVKLLCCYLKLKHRHIVLSFVILALSVTYIKFVKKLLEKNTNLKTTEQAYLK